MQYVVHHIICEYVYVGWWDNCLVIPAWEVYDYCIPLDVVKAFDRLNLSPVSSTIVSVVKTIYNENSMYDMLHHKIEEFLINRS